MENVVSKAKAFRDLLIGALEKEENILGIGQTGDAEAPLIPGKSDIDLFVLCKKVPSGEERARIYRELSGKYDSLTMEVCSGGVWGTGDIFLTDGIDVMPMYFTVSEMRDYAEEVLAGNRLEKEGRFYPIGRLASIESLHVFYDKEDAWGKIIRRVKEHPKDLFDKWYAFEAARMVDEEDLGRAELRHEVLFFHQVAEEFFDRFLMALYAKNDCYFPSRKRTEKAIAAFEKKPQNCYERLLKIASLGAHEETVGEAVEEIRRLAEELTCL